MHRMILASLLAGLALTAIAARADDWSKTYPIATRANLQVATDDGDVTVVCADQKQIVAHVTTEGYKIGPNDVRIDESQSGDHVIVTVKTPHLDFNLFGGMHRAVHVQVTVPRELDLSVSTGDGAVTLQPVAGHLQIHTADGAIHADGVRGDVSLHTADGSIDGRNLDGTLTANTGDGAVHVSGRFDGLQVATGDGSVDAQAAAGSHMTTGWSIHSGDGSVTLRVPQDLKAFVDLKTGDGSITVDMPVTVEGTVDRSHIRGNINGGGGGELKVTSGDGSIHLMKS